MSPSVSLRASRSGGSRLTCLVVAAVLAAVLLMPLMTIDGVKAWSIDPKVNTAVCTAASDQTLPVAVSDGAGGAIVTWTDYRGSDYDIYAQRISTGGVPLWTSGGVAICTAAGDQAGAIPVKDDAGGAIIVWEDYRSGNNNIYAQKINAAGAPQWTENGVAICTAAGDQASLAVDSDGAGGAIVTWHDPRSGGYDIYAQRVNSAGTPLWTGNGLAVCTAAQDQGYPSLTADGAGGGAVIGWMDARDGLWDIYSQRIDAAGAPQWTANGVAICAATNHQQYPGLMADGTGGAFVAWTDNRTGETDIYAQRVSSSGAPQWTSNGAAICTSDYGQSLTSGASDSSGGIILTWTDLRIGFDINVYSQRVSPSGECLWTDNGAEVCATAGFQMIADTAPDGAGGAIFSWMDNRDGIANYDIYAQRLDSSGTPQWTHDGVAVCTADDAQMFSPLVGDGSGGATVVWMDRRSGDNYDIYAQKVNSNGGLGAPPNQPANVAPAGGAAAVSVAPTLQSSAFSDPDAGDSHSRSEWRITGTPGDYSSPVFESSTENVSPAQVMVPSGRLNGNTTYYWQARYQDGQGGWSAWSAETSFTTEDRMPNRPANASSAGGAAAVIATPALQSSAFSDPDTGDAHAASQWRVTATAGDYSNPAFDSGTDNVNLTQIAVPSGKLSGNATYHWQVRHQDSHGGWSDWSAETTFTTLNQAPNRVTGASPAGGATGVSLTPTLESSTFSDPDTGDAHAASQWRIGVTAGDYSHPVFDSGTDNANLVGLAIPSGTLKNSTTYYWQVRHQDSHGEWSEWSEESSFATQGKSQAWIWIVVGAAGAVAVAAGGIGVVLLRRRRGAGQGGA